VWGPLRQPSCCGGAPATPGALWRCRYQRQQPTWACLQLLLLLLLLLHHHNQHNQLVYQPGVAVLHLPFPDTPLGAADHMAPLGSPHVSPPQQPPPAAEHNPGAGAGGWAAPTAGAALAPLADLLLPSPLALRMVCHEAGHALAALCPGWHLAAAAAASTAPAATQAPVSHQQQATPASDPASTFNPPPPPQPSPHPPPAAAAALSLLGCGRPGLDLAELPSHSLEHVAATPAALAALSCHGRLGTPLGPGAVGRLARLVAGGGGCGNRSSTGRGRGRRCGATGPHLPAHARLSC
jgi:hypothetical protein